MVNFKMSTMIRFDITESMANACLKVVELYLNENPDKQIKEFEYDDGNICLEIVGDDELDEDEPGDTIKEG